MKKIAVIIPYFGQWPVWIDLYFYSCSKNTTIDFIFFTDCNTSVVSAPNIIFFPQTFEEYCAKVSTELEISFKPVSAYKLCDLKPFYGYIHRDILKTYDFWGFGDIDLVWGDIRSFYTDKMLNTYNVFSTHADRLSGHLAILKNDKKRINKCFQIKNWKEKLCSDTNLALDEGEYSRLYLPLTKPITRFYTRVLMKILNWRDAWVIYYTFFPLYHFLFFSKFRGLYFKEQHVTPFLKSDGLRYRFESDTWYYKDGAITNNKITKNYMYLHFMLLKKNHFRDYAYWEGDYYHVKKEDLPKDVLINTQGVFLF